MTDGRAEPSDPDPGADPAATPQPGADRRSFLRQLSGNALVTAGKLAGASTVLRRSLTAGSEAAIGHFGNAADANQPSGDAPAGPPPLRARPADGANASASTLVASSDAVLPNPVAALTPEQHTFLAQGTRAALAVNDPGGHPLVAFTIFRWDGAVIRLPARDSTARTVDIDRDPRVSLLIDDPTSDAWVAVAGVASLVYGAQVEPEIRLILAKYHDEAGVARHWEEMRSAGDQLVIHVRPTRFVWRTG